MPPARMEHKYSTNALNGIFMYQLSLETSVCVKRKWNINVPLSGLMKYLYSNSEVQALFLVRQPAGVPQYLKQLDLHGRRQYWSRKILSISGAAKSGHDFTPRPNAPSEAELLGKLEENDADAQLYA
jgi:hypothetical protein